LLATLFFVTLQINGESRNFADGLTLAALIAQLGSKPDRVAVELNLEIVPRDKWQETMLRNGDRLEIVHFVGGGNSGLSDPTTLVTTHYRFHLTSYIMGVFCLKHFIMEMFDNQRRTTFDIANGKVEQFFNSLEAMKLTGITARQLQWWDERGIVVPQRQGRNRLYSEEDLAELAVISELRRKGFPLQRVRKVMRYLQREFGKRLAATVTAGSEYHLLTDGKRLYLENSERQIIDLLKNSRQPLLSICLTDAVKEIRGEIREHTAQAAKTGSNFSRDLQGRSRQDRRNRVLQNTA
jgi:thiamine biosynthesis protein ThiS